jgi:hypothetical protein
MFSHCRLSPGNSNRYRNVWCSATPILCLHKPVEMLRCRRHR